MPRSLPRPFRPSTTRVSSLVRGPAFSTRAGRAVLATALLLCAGVGAQAQVPSMKGEGAARHVCGGIGSDESTAMRSAMKSHPLSLLLARADGAYVADVGVTIRDAKGAEALRLSADGPICLIDLPAGRYNIEATSEGRTQRRDVTLGGAPTTADFRF